MILIYSTDDVIHASGEKRADEIGLSDLRGTLVSQMEAEAIVLIDSAEDTAYVLKHRYGTIRSGDAATIVREILSETYYSHLFEESSPGVTASLAAMKERFGGGA